MRSARELEHVRRMLQERAAIERMSLAAATEDLQDATDRVARVAAALIAIGRRLWLPVATVAAAALLRRGRGSIGRFLGPGLRLARTGLAVWQVARLIRAARQ